MKQLFLAVATATLLLGSPALADDSTSLAGKWSFKKVNDQGQNITQTIEIKKDKFVYEILSSDDRLVLHAEGDFKLEKLGPFSSAKFSHIKGGQSASDMQDVDDEYVSIYVLDGDTWLLVTNFDKQRDQQKPSMDAYQRVKSAPATKPAK